MKFECKINVTSNKKRTSKILAAKSVVRRSIKILNNKQQERKPTKQGKYHNHCLQSELETINFFTKEKVVPQMFTTTPKKTRPPTQTAAKTPQTLPKPKINASSKPTTTKFTRSQTPNAKSQQQQPTTPLRRQQPVKALNTINVLSKTPSAYARRQAQVQEKQQQQQHQQEMKTPSKPAHKSLIPTVKSQSSIKKPVTASNTPLNDVAKRGMYASNNAISEHKKPTKLTQIKRNIRRSLGFLKKCSSKEQLAVPLHATSSQSRLPIPSKTSSLAALSRIPLRIGGSTQSLNTVSTKSDDTMIQLEQLMSKHESNSDEIMVALPLSSLKRIINTPKAETKSKQVVNDVNMEIEGGDENETIENDLANSKQIEIMNKSGNHIKVSESSTKSQQIPKFYLQQQQQQPKTIQHNIDDIVSPFSMRNLFKPKTPQSSILANTENLTPTGLKRLLKTPKQQTEGNEPRRLMSNQKRQQIGSNLLEAISPAVFNCMVEGDSPAGAAATYKKPPFYKQFLTPNNNSAKKLKIFGDRQSTSKKQTTTSKYISPYVFEDVRLLAGSDEDQHLSGDLIKFDVDSLESTNDNLSQLEQLCSPMRNGSQSSRCVEKQVEVNSEETPEIYCVDRQFLYQITNTVISLQNKVVELEEKVVAGSQMKASQVTEETSKLNAVEVVYNHQETCENGVATEHLEVTAGEQIVNEVASQETEMVVENNEEEKVIPVIVVQQADTNESEMDVSVNVIAKENEQITIPNGENEVSPSDQQESQQSENTEPKHEANASENQIAQENVSPFATKNLFKNKMASGMSTNKETLTPVGMKRLLRTRKQHRESIVDSDAIETLFKETTNEQEKEIADKPETQPIADEIRCQQEQVVSENKQEKGQENKKEKEIAQENVSPLAMKNLFKNKLAPGMSTNKETLTPIGMKRLMRSPRTRKQHRDSIVDSTAIQSLFKEQTREIPTIQVTIADETSVDTITKQNEQTNDENEKQSTSKSQQEPVLSEIAEQKPQIIENKTQLAQENVSPFAMKNLFKNKLASGISTNKESITPVGMKRLLRTPRTRKQHRDSIVDSAAIETLFKETTNDQEQKINEKPEETQPIADEKREQEQIVSENVEVKEAHENQEIINDTIEEDNHRENDENVASNKDDAKIDEQVLNNEVCVESIEMSVSTENKKVEKREQMTIKNENKLADEVISPFAMKNLFKGKKGEAANAENLTPVGMKRLLHTPRTRKQHRDSLIDASAIETLFKQQETSTNDKAPAPIELISDKQIASLKKQKSQETCVSPFAMKNLFKNKLQPGTTTNLETLTPVGMKRLLRTPKATLKQQQQQQQRDSIEPAAINNLFQQQEPQQTTTTTTTTSSSQNLDKSMEGSELDVISQSTVVSNLLKETNDVVLTPNDLLQYSLQLSLPPSLTCESIDRLLTTNKDSCQGNNAGLTPSISTEIRQIIEIDSDEALCQLSNALTGDNDDYEEEMSISYVEMKNQSVSPMDVDDDPYVAGTLPTSLKQTTIIETDSNVKVNESRSTIKKQTTPTTPLLDCKVQVHLNLVNDACTHNNSIRIMDVDNTNNNNNNNADSHYNKVEEEENNVDDFILINNRNINRNSINNILNNNNNKNNNIKKKMVDSKTDNGDTTSSNGVQTSKSMNDVDLNKHKSLHENGSSNLENSKKQSNDDDSTTTTTITKSSPTNGSSINNNNNGCEKVSEEDRKTKVAVNKSNEADSSTPTVTASAAVAEVTTVSVDKSTTNVVEENNKKDEATAAAKDGESKSKEKMDVVEKKSSDVEQVAAASTVSVEEKAKEQVVEEKSKEEEKVVEEETTKTKTTRRNARGKQQQQPPPTPAVDTIDSGVEATKPTRSKRNQKGKGATEKEQEPKQQQSSQEEEKVESVKETATTTETEVTTKGVEKPDEVIQETQEVKKDEVAEKSVAQKEEAKPVTSTSEEKPVEEKEEEEAKVETVEETKKPAARGGRAKAAPKGKKGKQAEEATTTTETTAAPAVVASKEPEVVVEEKKEEKAVEVAAVVTEEAKAEEKEVEEKPKGKKAPAKKAPARGRGKAAAAAVVEEVKEEEAKKEAEQEVKVEEKKEEETSKTEEKKEEKVAETENEEETTPKTKAAPKGRGGARTKKTTTTTIEVKEVEEEKPAGRVTRSRQVKIVEEVKEPEPAKKSATPAKGARTATKRKAQAAEPEPVEPESQPTEVVETTKEEEEQPATTNAAKRRAIGKKQQKEKEPEPEPVVEKKVVEEEKPVVEEEAPVSKKSSKKQEEKRAAEPEPEAQKPTTAKKGGRGASKRKVSVDVNESTASQEAAASTEEGVKRVTRAQAKRSKK